MVENAGRETQILGAPIYSSLLEVPICRGNSQICRFISCTAHNFKNDDNFSNLNLAAQLLGDKKMRKIISSYVIYYKEALKISCSRNPEAIGTVCREQGLSDSQCRLFSRSFQLIDRFMSNIEKPSDISVSNSLNEVDDPTLKPFEENVTIRTSPLKQRVVNLSTPRNSQMGSQTWSTHQRVLDNPRSVKQIIKHSTTNRSQPLGMTESPRQRIAPKSPPRVYRPSMPTKMQQYQTTNHIPIRPARLPELEEEEDDYDYVEGEVISRPRGKRSDDYYDQVDKTETSTSAINQKKKSVAKMNCFQYLGGI
jgi:hypothetical protein